MTDSGFSLQRGFFGRDSPAASTLPLQPKIDEVFGFGSVPSNRYDPHDEEGQTGGGT